MDFTRPRLLVSGCIESARCSHKGDIVESETVRRLMDNADCTFLCPETGIGLSVPRSPLFLEKTPSGIRIIQSGTGADLTEEIRSWSEKTLSENDKPDGIILKFRSASCGNSNVRIYPFSGEKNPLAIKGTGIFAQALIRLYPDLPVTTEAHLKNPFMRERYLTSLYASAGLRAMGHHGSRAALQEFHAHHKLLLMAWDEKSMRILGHLAADTHQPADEAIRSYSGIFLRALKKFPSTGSHINVLNHVTGFFSRLMSCDQKNNFIKTIDLYKRKMLPLSGCLALARSLIAEYDVQYLKDQVYFSPFPEALLKNNHGKKNSDNQ